MKIKKEVVECDWVRHGDYWGAHELCGGSGQIEVEDQGFGPQIAGKKVNKKKCLVKHWVCKYINIYIYIYIQTMLFKIICDKKYKHRNHIDYMS